MFLPMVSAQNIYPDPGSWLPNVPGRWAPAGFSCGGPGHSRQSLGPVGTGGWEGGETSLSFPSIPATLGFGEPPKMKPAQQAALYPESEPLQLTPGRGTQICDILILSKLCKTPLTEVPLGRASSARTAGRDSISTEG